MISAKKETFKAKLLSMFSSIWDCKIDHPIFDDTVGDLMKAVLQTYEQEVELVKPHRSGMHAVCAKCGIALGKTAQIFVPIAGLK